MLLGAGGDTESGLGTVGVMAGVMPTQHAGIEFGPGGQALRERLEARSWSTVVNGDNYGPVTLFRVYPRQHLDCRLRVHRRMKELVQLVRLDSENGFPPVHPPFVDHFHRAPHRCLGRPLGAPALKQVEPAPFHGEFDVLDVVKMPFQCLGGAEQLLVCRRQPAGHVVDGLRITDARDDVFTDSAPALTGSVSGIPAILLNEGSWRNYDVIVLLVKVVRDAPDFRAGAAVAEALARLAPGAKCDVPALLKEAEVMEKTLKKLRNEQMLPTTKEQMYG